MLIPCLPPLGNTGWLRSSAFTGSLLSVSGEDHEQLASCLRIPWRVLCVCYSRLRKYFQTSPDLLDCQNLVGPSLGSTSWIPPSSEKWIFLQTLFSLLRPPAQDFAPQPLSHLSLVPGSPLSYCHRGLLECSKLFFFFFFNSTAKLSSLISKPVYAILFYFKFFYTHFFCKYPQDLVWYPYICILLSFLSFLGSLSQFFHLKYVFITLKN